ncbi:hypothetical protein DFJ73DRAFT_838956, partial [Zopfochytrium polystomum]
PLSDRSAGSSALLLLAVIAVAVVKSRRSSRRGWSFKKFKKDEEFAPVPQDDYVERTPIQKMKPSALSGGMTPPPALRAISPTSSRSASPAEAALPPIPQFVPEGGVPGFSYPGDQSVYSPYYDYGQYGYQNVPTDPITGLPEEDVSRLTSPPSSNGSVLMGYYDPQTPQIPAQSDHRLSAASSDSSKSSSSSSENGALVITRDGQQNKRRDSDEYDGKNSRHTTVFSDASLAFSYLSEDFSEQDSPQQYGGENQNAASTQPPPALIPPPSAFASNSLARQAIYQNYLTQMQYRQRTVPAPTPPPRTASANAAPQLQAQLQEQAPRPGSPLDGVEVRSADRPVIVDRAQTVYSEKASVVIPYQPPPPSTPPPDLASPVIPTRGPSVRGYGVKAPVSGVNNKAEAARRRHMSLMSKKSAATSRLSQKWDADDFEDSDDDEDDGEGQGEWAE